MASRNIPGRSQSLQKQLDGGTRGQAPVWTTESGQAPNVQSPTGATSGPMPKGDMNAPASVTSVPPTSSGA